MWEWFKQMGYPVTWNEIQAWAALTAIKPHRYEAELLILLERVRGSV